MNCVLAQLSITSLLPQQFTEIFLTGVLNKCDIVSLMRFLLRYRPTVI